MKVPVEDYLRRFTQNQGLFDIITQHFFRGTPAFFALSYLKLYLDYYYPRGGTGTWRRWSGRVHRRTSWRDKDPDEDYVDDPRQSCIGDGEGTCFAYIR